MKNLLLFTMLFIVIACNQNTKEDETPPPCSLPPPTFLLLVNKNSELHKEFVNEKGEVDKEHISLFKEESNQKKKYNISFYYSNVSTNGNDYLVVSTQLSFTNDVYTGKTETLYLQNATKTYKIEVNGSMQNGECGKYAVTNEIRVDGTKIEVPYLAK